jgi:hypothetical protein
VCAYVCVCVCVRVRVCMCVCVCACVCVGGGSALPNLCCTQPVQSLVLGALAFFAGSQLLNESCRLTV